jgi:ParB family transcriptional regulator, chromosome partitioning protein
MVDRRLGRGLDFFLSGGKPQPQPPAAAVPPPERVLVAEAKRVDVEEVAMVELDRLVVSPYQPRKTIDEAELQELAESVRASGILQPILARRVGDRFEIVAGERRWRAARIAGLAKVPVLVRAISDQDSAVFGLVENLQREDLNAIEKAEGFRLLMTKLGATQDEVAKRVGLERSSVANFLRLLDLPKDVQAHVSRGTLTMGHARTLLALPDAEAMVACADECIKQAWSVRALEAKVREALEASKGTPSAKASDRARPVWLNELEESLVEALGTPVTIRYGRKRSQIVIECAGREEFERVFQRLKNA